jgi:hypothetical protein
LKEIDAIEDKARSLETRHAQLSLKPKEASDDGSRLVTKKERDRLLDKILDAWIGEVCLEEKLFEHIDAHYAPRCLQICEHMQQKLPRELRDMIYAYILDTRTQPLVQNELAKDFPESMRCTRPWTPANKPDASIPWICQIKYDLRHICDKDYVGLETMQEIAEAYYRGSVFSFNMYATLHPEPLSQHYFEATDRWAFGLEAASLIRRLELGLNSKELAESPAKAQEDLGSLLRLTKALSITIIFDEFRLDEDRQLEIATAISTLFPTLEKLLATGHMIVVGVHHRYRPGWQFNIPVSWEELEYAWWQRRLRDERSKAEKAHAAHEGESE